MSAVTDPARLCHAEARRFDPGEARQLDPAGSPSLWVEDVPEPADSATGRAWRDRELARPTGSGVREVLLRYAGGAADLVTVRHRGHRGDTDLAELESALRRIDAEPPPDWGLGDPSAGSTVGRLEVLGPSAGDEPHVTVAAALGLVLARYSGEATVAVGGADPRLAAVLRPDPLAPVRAYLDAARAAPLERVPSLVGLTVTGPAAQRPFLAPVQPLSIHVSGAGEPVLRAVCWYRRRYFDHRIVAQLARHLVAAHHALLDAPPQCRLGEVELFDAAERRRLVELGGLRRTAVSIWQPRHRRIDEAVAARAAANPDAVAVRCEGRALTYAELDTRAGRAAAALRALGVGPGVRVGICLDRSLDLVVAMLAVLKAGGAYVPMDPRYPAQRLAFTVADAGVALMIGEPGAIGGVRQVPVEALTAGAPSVGPSSDGTPDDAAYVIYTSGSTGTPKGVVVPHRNVASLLAATGPDFDLGPEDVWTLFHSPAFDFSVWEIWGCLMTGGRLVVVPHWSSRSPEAFAGLLADEGATVLSQTPSAFGQLVEADRARPLPRSLRLVVLGGEPLDTRALLPWFDRHPESGCRLVNMFGITETTVHVTAQTVPRREALAGSRSVGRPLPGWHLYVLDQGGRPVPPGVAGEVYVGGAGVAGGYLNRPELTAQRFLADPHTGTTMYRTGDRGRLLPDGRLEHLGRLDDQVQLRGFRIELDEVRAALLAAPGVAAAAVVLRRRGSDAATAHLAGYVVFQGGAGQGGAGQGGAGQDGAGQGRAAQDAEAVRAHLARTLPEHMLPATITSLPALPLTTNGKVDVARLPEPARRRLPTTAAAPATLAERVLAAWESIFGFRVGPDDDFFALGGNSLLAVRLSTALRGAGLPDVTVRQLYRHRSAGRLAAALEAV